MKGPFAMDPTIIRQRVPPEPGAYALGTAQNRALYVSRADDLRARLLTHFVSANTPNVVIVDQFWFQTAANPLEAYRLECTWYHQFSPTHNATHPVRPVVLLVSCPICGR